MPPTGDAGAVPTFGSFRPVKRADDRHGVDESIPGRGSTAARVASQGDAHKARPAGRTRRSERVEGRTSHGHRSAQPWHRERTGTDQDRYLDGTRPASPTSSRVKDDAPLFVMDRFGDVNAARYGPSAYSVPRHHASTSSDLRTRSRTYSDRPARKRQRAHAVDTGEKASARRDTTGTGDDAPLPEYVAVRDDSDDMHEAYRDPYRSTVTTTQREEAPDDRAPWSQDAPQEKSRALHARLQDEPTDVDAWMSLVELQAELVGPATSTHAERHAATLARLQLAVVERALQAAPANGTSLTMRLVQLRIAADHGLWDKEQLECTWRSLLAQPRPALDDTVAAWQAYASFRASDAANFRVDDMVAVYAEALAAVSVHRRTCDSPVDVDLHRMNFVAGACNLLRQAGTCFHLRRLF